jgi:hypothetical protein
MIEIKFNTEQVKIAEWQAKNMGELPRSIRHGDGTVAGFIGEMLAQKVYGGRQVAGNPHYDLILPDGRTAEVKTKRTKAVPQPYYVGSVSMYWSGQRCNILIFCRVNLEALVGWVMGDIDKVDFSRLCEARQKGDIDGSNGMIIEESCYNITYDKLRPPPRMEVPK